MDWNKGVDVSYNSLLLEDTADSHDTEAVPDLKTHAAEVAIAGDDDDLQDAESCSCDCTSDYNKRGFSKVDVDDCDDQDSDGGSNFGNDGDDHCEKSADSFCEIRSTSDVALECNFSKEEEKKIGEFNNMDEMEDRLFWETCMAEGYP
ncbi:hypothetical protein I3843_01G146000 [Carya illinoinensis]|uniref:Uncharacterized protein n=1 Tax=Carya illinoinensis TaxID=32201 RepID=A0A8T1RQR5_CARIL|nr:hypothetical protein CIPAW_01G154900 [Carya illinoinensis]KAG6731953.1 hypothetical protein I3842_01G153400 [Carya illinoinensis]KAG7996177.1 hypothetical protein I3843_01G146000 [Carya illinoinensis]